MNSSEDLKNLALYYIRSQEEAPKGFLLEVKNLPDTDPLKERILDAIETKAIKIQDI